jgi:hypothetical protein
MFARIASVLGMNKVDRDLRSSVHAGPIFFVDERQIGSSPEVGG